MSTTATKTLQPIPYLMFDGTCLEALQFYARTLGGNLEFTLTYGDSPFADQFPDEFKTRIMNGRLVLPGGMLMYGGDIPPHMQNQPYHPASIALNFDTAEEATQVFNALSEGGKINMPLDQSFWSKRFGMLTDRFGTDWMINGELVPM